MPNTVVEVASCAGRARNGLANALLFNSHGFLWGFLPLALAGFFVLGKRRVATMALCYLALASLAFYAYWDPRNLLILVPSLLGNFVLGRLLHKSQRKSLLLFGLATNLGGLAYFKYKNFLLGSITAVTGVDFALSELILPLGISFFTFEQIAYLVDTYRGQSRRYSFWEYTLFVLFFPHLIAGPIIQHDELLNQLDDKIHKPHLQNIAVGLTLFGFGLIKKVLLADSVADYVAPIYDAPGAAVPTAFAAWLGTLAYSLQLYFDFSGYSDMALGLARMFNLKLPQNFNSPYKAPNIIEFWRRWHMTLSRFLRNYLYIPLGGNRGSSWRRYTNLLLTMLLGGLWHGAGWGFVIWGGLNGLYLVVNHVFNKLYKRTEPLRGAWLQFSTLLTFLCVMLSRVFFRAEDLATIRRTFLGLWGYAGWGTLPEVLQNGRPIFLCAALYVFCRIAPNSQEVLAYVQPTLGKITAVRWAWRFNLATGAALALVVFASVLLLNRVSAFLYFQF